MKIATCPTCNNTIFAITDTGVLCVVCGREFPFNFICDGVCETKASDVVMLINEGY
jgi:hypothetical protein